MEEALLENAYCVFYRTLEFRLTDLRRKNTETVIRTILKSRPYEVQTYRMCLGILDFTKKYSNKTLEECCKQAVALNKQKYTFIKNTILEASGGITYPPRTGSFFADVG